jgi:hypothetical protein
MTKGDKEAERELQGMVSIPVSFTARKPAGEIR